MPQVHRLVWAGYGRPAHRFDDLDSVAAPRLPNLVNLDAAGFVGHCRADLGLFHGDSQGRFEFRLAGQDALALDADGRGGVLGAEGQSGQERVRTFHYLGLVAFSYSWRLDP